MDKIEIFTTSNKNTGDNLLGKKRKHDGSEQTEKSAKSLIQSNSSLFAVKSELRGRWNRLEHIRFVKGCLIHGNDWTKVSRLT